MQNSSGDCFTTIFHLHFGQTALKYDEFIFTFKGLNIMSGIFTSAAYTRSFKKFSQWVYSNLSKDAKFIILIAALAILSLSSCATKPPSLVELMPYSVMHGDYESSYFSLVSYDSFKLDGEITRIQVVFSILIDEKDYHKVYKNQKYLMYVTKYLQEEFNNFCREYKEDLASRREIENNGKDDESMNNPDFPVNKFVWWFNGQLVYDLNGETQTFLGDNVGINGFYMRSLGAFSIEE